MPHLHDDDSFIQHQLGWEPGTEGKGFLIKPTPMGVQNWPYLAQAQPLVWTWPTENMRPTHPQVRTGTPAAVPQGMAPDPTSYFHIKPDGGIWLYGSGRQLSDDDYATIGNADPRLLQAQTAPQVDPDSYGHANRLLEILKGSSLRRWLRWREFSRSKD